MILPTALNNNGQEAISLEYEEVIRLVMNLIHWGREPKDWPHPAVITGSIVYLAHD
jgi:hypothetical protein